jgi:transposase
MEPGMNVSHVARLHGIQPSLLFKWKKQYQEGSLTAVAWKKVRSASELTAALKQVREPAPSGQEDDGSWILKEAVEYGQSRKWIAHALVAKGRGIAMVSHHGRVACATVTAD